MEGMRDEVGGLRGCVFYAQELVVAFLFWEIYVT